MKRRTFVAGLLGAVTLPFAVHAQRAGKPPVIGYIGANNEAIDRPRINAFMQRLSDIGWADGRNIAVDARFTQGVNCARVLTHLCRLTARASLQERPGGAYTEAVRIGFSPRKLFWEMDGWFRGAEFR